MIANKIWKNLGMHIVVALVVIIFTIASIMYSSATRMIDYDNAVYFRNAIFIIEGKIPYKDFAVAKTPLYLYLLSFIFSIFGVGFDRIIALDIFIGALTIVGIYLLGCEFKGSIAGILAALFYSLSFFSILMHVAGKTEPLFNLLLVYAILLLIKSKIGSR